MKNKISIAILAVTILIGGIWFWQKPDTAKQAGIKIAANLPMSGPLATYGVAVREGANMALDELSSSDGASSLRKIAIDWQDNASDPKASVSIFQKQLLENPNIYVSGVKPQTMAIMDGVTKEGLPHFVWIFDAKINQKSKNNFRTWVSYKIEPPVYLDYIKRRGAKRIAITYVQLPHTIEEFEKILVPQLKNQDGSDILVEAYDFGRSDFKDLAVKIAKFKPDLIILNGFQSDLVGLIRSLRPLGVVKDGNTIATYDLLDAAKILGADEIEGIRIVAPLFETRADSETIAKWRERFIAKYGHPPLYTHAFAYDMVGAIHAASLGLKLPASNEQWIDALRAVNVQGITGPIRFDSDGDMVTPLEVGVFRSGKLAPDTTVK